MLLTTSDRTKKWTKTALGLAMATSMTLTGGSMAAAVPDVGSQSLATENESGQEDLHLSEAQLAEIGLTKADAEQLALDFAQAVDAAERRGDITASEAEALRESLVDGPGSGDSESVGTTMALPVWAAAAIVGCAGSVILGQGKTQITNALQEGATVDEASDIAIGVGVDCVFGAVPGGAIGAAAKQALTQPVKGALKPHVRKVVQDLADDIDD